MLERFEMQNSQFAEDFMSFFKIVRLVSMMLFITFIIFYFTGLWEEFFVSIDDFKKIVMIDLIVFNVAALMRPVARLAKLLFPEL